MTLSQHVLYGLFVCAQDPKILSRNFQILPLYTLHTDDICLDFTFIYMFTLFRFCLIVCCCSQFWESLDCLCVCVHVLHLFLQLFYWCVAAYVCVCVWFLGEIVFFSTLVSAFACLQYIIIAHAYALYTEILNTIDIQQRVFQWNS